MFKYNVYALAVYHKSVQGRNISVALKRSSVDIMSLKIFYQHNEVALLYVWISGGGHISNL